MIEIKNVYKAFEGENVLSDLSMHLDAGNIYGLVGPNGAGKTTIINIICGVYKEDAGEVLIDGKSVYENIDVKNSIGYIQDDLYYYNQYSIYGMKEFYKSQYKNFSEEMYEKLKKIFDIDEKKRIKSLSKGMKKQVAFWLTLSTMPKLLVLDEPLDGLDPINRRKVIKILASEVEKRNMTTLVSSHNLRELEDICDTVGILDKGHMVLEKKMDEITDNIIKVQVVYDDEEKLEEIKDKLDIRHIASIGRAYHLIIKGDKDEVLDIINESNARVVDVLPLTLEEIFLYEIGKEDVDVNKYFN